MVKITDNKTGETIGSMDFSGTGAAVSCSSYSGYNSTTTAGMHNWNYPEFKEVKEVGETVEMVYTQTSTFSRLGGMPPYHDERVFKIVYSCVEGKWNKSEPVYGKIIAAEDEYYEFEE